MDMSILNNILKSLIKTGKKVPLYCKVIINTDTLYFNQITYLCYLYKIYYYINFISFIYM